MTCDLDNQQDTQFKWQQDRVSRSAQSSATKEVYYGRPDSIVVDGAVIRRAMSVCNLGAHFDIHLSMVSQVSANLQEVQLPAPLHCIHQSLYLESCVSRTGHCSGSLQLGLLLCCAARHPWISSKTPAGSSPPSASSGDTGRSTGSHHPCDGSLALAPCMLPTALSSRLGSLCV